MKNWLVTVLVSAVVAMGVGLWMRSASVEGGMKETAFERVMRTGVLRCGYVVWPVQMEVDLKTGKRNGFGYDFAEAIGRELGVKVVWAEEVGWGNFGEGLNTGRYDAMCVPVWRSGARARAALLTQPLGFEAMRAFHRVDDRRFEGGLASLNDPKVRIAVVDGDITQAVKKSDFPLAQEVGLSAVVDSGTYMTNVTLGKADILFTQPASVMTYNKNNPQSRLVEVKGNVRQNASVFAVAHGEHDLKAALDAVIETLYTEGTAQKIVAKYQGLIEPVRAGYAD